MAILRKDVTLLKNLVTFEMASRSLNFTRAAEKLGVSRVAVSRQIAELEDSLGEKFFFRNHRDVSLTDAGKALASQVNPALQTISESLHLFRNKTRESRLSVTTTNAFATYWLMPRLIDFNTKHPQIDINLVVSDKYLGMDTEDIDVAIRYSGSAPKIGVVKKLMKERIFPVYSPKYQKKTPLTTPNDLIRERLLHLSGDYKTEAGWSNWFNNYGLQEPESGTGVTVNTYINMLQAAIEGQGVALAGHPLIDQFLEDGSLLTIKNIKPLEREFFFLINRSTKKPDAIAFCDWIEKKTKTTGITHA